MSFWRRCRGECACAPISAGQQHGRAERSAVADRLRRRNRGHVRGASGAWRTSSRMETGSRPSARPRPRPPDGDRARARWGRPCRLALVRWRGAPRRPSRRGRRDQCRLSTSRAVLAIWEHATSRTPRVTAIPSACGASASRSSAAARARVSWPRCSSEVGAAAGGGARRARQPSSGCAATRSSGGSGRLGPILYAPTDVGPLWYSRLVERPGLFGCLPRPAQDRIAARSIRPACAHFVRMRLDRVRLTTGVEVTRSAGSCG